MSDVAEEQSQETARAFIQQSCRKSMPMPTASIDSNDSTAGSSQAMATLTIRNLDDAVRDRLRRRAAEHGHSMEEEVRQILCQVVEPTKPAATKEGLGTRIHNHFARLGGLELELPSRNDTPTAESFEL
jgi:plasmid stability protein